MLVIGVGNPYRGDDGVGAAVAQAVAALGADHVEVVELDGDPARLVDAWDGFDVVVVVDAVVSGAPPGTIHVLDPGACDRLTPEPGASSHGAGVAEAVGLGRVLDRLPPRLVVVGVEAEHLAPGCTLSPAVAAAVAPATAAVIAALTPTFSRE